MKTVSIDVYEFSELSDKAKQRALEELRDINVDFEWWDYDLEYWQEKLAELGYEDVEIQFSGFWSQGDGASFTASLDFTKLVKRLCDQKDIELIEQYTTNIYGKLERTSHQYSHKYTVQCSYLEYDTTDELYDMQRSDDDETVEKADEIANRLEVLMEELRDAITSDAREQMDDIYDSLEKEYEWRTADEQIIETIEINDYMFLENGELTHYS